MTMFSLARRHVVATATLAAALVLAVLPMSPIATGLVLDEACAMDDSGSLPCIEKTGWYCIDGGSSTKDECDPDVVNTKCTATQF